jgi:CheY-like chemotaxis protein
MRALESERGAARTPILALTAHALKQEVAKSREAGCDAHLTKPIAKETLLEALVHWTRAPAAFAGAAAAAAPPAEPGPAVPDANAVRVDPSLADAVPEYLDKRRRDIPAMLTALGFSDYTSIRVAGHNMKGSGGGFGFPGLSEIGARLEEAALRQDAAGVRSQIEALAEYLAAVQLQFD